MSAGWRLQGDALDGGGLRVALQRIASSHWRAQGVLRSWGLAPLHRVGDSVCVPCADEESLWLGAWAEPPGGHGRVSLRAAPDAQEVHIEVPPQQAITALADGQPITRSPPQARRELSLRLAPATPQPACLLTLVLMAPADWSGLSGRPWAPLQAPPPRPPRLG